MKVDVEAYQTHWHPEEIEATIPSTPDTQFIFDWWDWHVQRSASPGAPGRVLDVACGNARDITKLSAAGWEAVGLDPSPLQLRDARTSAEEAGRPLRLVCGVAEWLPFRPGVFDSLICKSALDHLVDRDSAMREFARVLQSEGRAVVSVNNYASFSVRVSRIIYRVARFLRPSLRQNHFLWDTPVPQQHTYECTYKNTLGLGAPHFDTLQCYGVSLLWGIPGWSRFLSVLPYKLNRAILHGLNGLARYVPRFADAVVFVWRPKTKP